MKKTIKRGIVKAMYETLSQFPLGHLATDDLEKVMDNMYAFLPIKENAQKLLEELNKRLFEGVSKEDIDAYNSIQVMIDGAQSQEKKVSYIKVRKEKYPQIYELVIKQNKMIEALLNKDVDVEVSEMDKKVFIKAILKGNPNIPTAEFDLFDAMFVAEEKKETETDFSELDELMAE